MRDCFPHYVIHWEQWDGSDPVVEFIADYGHGNNTYPVRQWSIVQFVERMRELQTTRGIHIAAYAWDDNTHRYFQV